MSLKMEYALTLLAVAGSGEITQLEAVLETTIGCESADILLKLELT